MPSNSLYHTALEGILVTQISATATTATLKVRDLNGVTPTWLTGAHRLTALQSTQTTDKVEVMDITSASQSGSTVTLTIGTRGLPLDGTGFSGTGTAQVFTSGARFIVTWDAQAGRQTAFKDIANTFSAAQTVTAPLAVSGTSSYIAPPELTQAQEDALVGMPEGSIIKNSTTNTNRQYIGGSWASVGTDATPNMSATVAGKGELALVADTIAMTGNGGSGAPVVIGTDICVTDSDDATWVEGAVPVLNSSKFVDVSILGSGTPDGTKFLRDDNTFSVPSLLHYVKILDIEHVTSTTLTNPTTLTEFDTGQFTLTSGSLAVGNSIEFRANGTVTPASGNVNIYVRIGSVDVVSHIITPASTSAQRWILEGEIRATAAAGASVTVDYISRLLLGVNGNDTHSNLEPLSGSTGSVVTNSNQTFKYMGAIGASNGSNVMALDGSTVKLNLTTPA